MREVESNTVTVGRYLLHRQIARGGMATIHIARLMGDEGFNRIVAAKRLLPEFAEDTEFVAMFMDEARIASKVHHPNVVPVLDLVTTVDEVMLVQEYVHGVPLHVLLRTAHEKNVRFPARIAVAIATQVLAGLHAAHTTLDEMGTPLDIIHRDVSPQNIMIAVDGSARLLDFGVAKATMAAHVTRDNTFKGKLAYSSPEQVRGRPVQQTDVYAISVVLWELLVGARMHGKAKGEAELVATIMTGRIPMIGEVLDGEISDEERRLVLAADPIVQKGLAVDLEHRWQTAADMEEALSKAVPPASSSEVAAWVRSVGQEFLEGRDKIIAAEEASWRRTHGATLVSSRRIGTTLPIANSEPPPGLRGHNAIILVLAALVLVLGAGVVFAMHGTPPAAATPAPTPPTQVAEPAPVPAPVEEPKPAVAPPEPVVEPAPAPAPEPAPDDEPAEPPKAMRDAPPVRRPPMRPAPRAVKQVVKAAPLPVPAAAPPVAPAPPPVPAKEAEPKADCNPPYYFEGQKKVFKTNCL